MRHNVQRTCAESHKKKKLSVSVKIENSVIAKRAHIFKSPSKSPSQKSGDVVDLLKTTRVPAAITEVAINSPPSQRKNPIVTFYRLNLSFRSDISTSNNFTMLIGWIARLRLQKKNRLFWLLIEIAKKVMNYNLSKQTRYAVHGYVIYIRAVYVSVKRTLHGRWINTTWHVVHCLCIIEIFER